MRGGNINTPDWTQTSRPRLTVEGVLGLHLLLSFQLAFLTNFCYDVLPELSSGFLLKEDDISGSIHPRNEIAGSSRN